MTFRDKRNRLMSSIREGYLQNQEERMLVRKFNNPQERKEALALIYRKYKDDLLSLARSILVGHGKQMAEDVLNEIIVSFAGQAGRFDLSGSLKGYLVKCVCNRARNVNRSMRQRRVVSLQEDVEEKVNREEKPWNETEEMVKILSRVLDELPEEQREVILLRLKGKITFQEIAGIQGISIHTVQSRYRYGLEKLRILFHISEV